MTRIRLLTGIHMFAEAASMIASIQYTLSTFSHYEYVLEEGQTIDAVLASSRNGMKYYGKAPFFNHLLPTSDDNKAACEWIGQYPGGEGSWAVRRPVLVGAPGLSHGECRVSVRVSVVVVGGD